MVLTIIIFILVLGILIIAHEFGHFIAAKLSNIKVEEFALGFPPKIFKKRYKETLYLVNLFPIGGYVKMLGEEENISNPRSYSVQPVSKKILVSVAGVIMNIVLAWLILTIGFSVGMTPIVSAPKDLHGQVLENSILVADIEKDSVAEKAGILVGDQIISIIDKDGVEHFFSSKDAAAGYIKERKGGEATIKISRQGENVSIITDLPEKEFPLGVALVDNSKIRVSILRAPLVAAVETGKLFKLTFDFFLTFFKKIFTQGEVIQEVGGPIAIYSYTGMAISYGFMAVMQLIAILSVNLALVNLIPLPALDGGKILFLVLRKIMGKYFIKDRIENIIHMVGFVVLVLLMIFITYRDIVKYF